MTGAATGIGQAAARAISAQGAAVALWDIDGEAVAALAKELTSEAAPCVGIGVDVVFDRIVGVNLKGVWLCMKHQIGQMKAGNGGAIVNNASVAGLVGFQGQAGYSATKHGVIGLSKSAAVECAPVKIRVNAVCPGAVRTPILRHLEAAGVTEAMLESMSPQGRIAEPSEIAEAVVWLLSEKSSFVTGAAMPIDGGWTTQ